MGQPHFETVATLTDRMETHQIWCLEATAEQNGQAILTIRRRHWSIESKSHHSRDKTYQEDTCQVRNHQAARTLVAFRIFLKPLPSLP